MNNNSIGLSLLQLGLETGVPLLGKNAQPVYQIAKSVSKSNKVSNETKVIAGIVMAGILVAVGYLYFGKAVDYLNS